ncbi:MAG TPA: formate dehydrogenase accessory protein FdhE [Anaeromyxobacteraceae bacterium]|nr:formate dehydrogenase accessory protein FdhE [Anaeromyxobacteraceae bacterium]
MRGNGDSLGPQQTVIGADAGDVAPVRLPDAARVFEARAERFAQLAKGHAAAPFLELLSAIARGQRDAIREIRIPAGAHVLDGVPLDHARWERDPSWRAMLRVVLGACRGGALPPAAREVIDDLDRAGAAQLEALAADVLAGSPRDLASAPFVGAALQAYFTRLASGLDAKSIGAGRAECPVCGSPPVAAVVLGTERVRYVVCSLCAAEWHVTRSQCSICCSGAATSYYSVEGAAEGTQAETCDACKAYLKVFDRQDAPAAEPLADDAASVVLDVLVGERGYRRAGVNLLAPLGEPA